MTTVGDANFLQNYLINSRVYGVVVPPGSPPEFLATFEIAGDQGTLLIAVAIGDKGPAGQNMFPLHLQNDEIDDPADLPQTLTNSPADIGKFWVIDDIDANDEIIGLSLYVWYGNVWRRLMNGSPGPPGLVPIITPNLTVLPPDEASTVTVDPESTVWEPDLDFALALPRFARPCGGVSVVP